MKGGEKTAKSMVVKSIGAPPKKKGVLLCMTEYKVTAVGPETEIALQNYLNPI